MYAKMSLGDPNLPDTPSRQIHWQLVIHPDLNNLHDAPQFVNGTGARELSILMDDEDSM